MCLMINPTSGVLSGPAKLTHGPLAAGRPNEYDASKYAAYLGGTARILITVGFNQSPFIAKAFPLKSKYKPVVRCY